MYYMLFDLLHVSLHRH